MKWGPEYAHSHDLSSLRLLGSVGEPINPEAWVWYREHVGSNRTPIVDTWWQTETGMIMITPLPGVTTTKPGSATRPFPGIDAAVYDESGAEVGPGGGGYLVLRRPWPSMLRGIFGDDARYRETYWSKYPDTYFAGDGARVDADGDFWLLGRVDDVMNVSGHRISTIEVESALVDHQAVAEAAVCGRTDALTGQAIVAYVTLKGTNEGSVEMLNELRDHVGEQDRARSRNRRTSCSRRSCRRPVPARSCGGCCATWPSSGSWETRPRWRIRRWSMRSSGGRGPRRRSSEQAGLPAAAHHVVPGGAHAGAVLEAALLAYALPPDPPQPEHRGRYPDCDGKDDELIRHRPSLRQSRGTRWATAEAGLTEAREENQAAHQHRLGLLALVAKLVQVGLAAVQAHAPAAVAATGRA